MKLIDRYILRKFIMVLTTTILAFTLIVFVVDFVEVGWRLMQRYNVGLDIMALYYINYLPFYIILAFPVAMLVSTLFTMGSLARNRELDVMKASGLSLYRIVTPLLCLGFVFSIAVMFFGEFVLTGCERRKNEIKNYQIEKRQQASKSVRENIKVSGENGWIILGEKYNVQKMEGTNVRVHRIVDNRIVKSYAAKSIIHSDSGWILISGSGMEHSGKMTISPSPANLSGHFIKFDTLWVPFLTQSPEVMAELPIPPRQMNFFDLQRRIEQKKILGELFRKEQVELFLKITFPFTNFILVLIGAPLAANPRRSGPSVGFGLAIIISFVFFVLVRIGQSLGNNGKIPPLLAASLGNIVFITIGVFLLFKARK